MIKKDEFYLKASEEFLNSNLLKYQQKKELTVWIIREAFSIKFNF